MIRAKDEDKLTYVYLPFWKFTLDIGDIFKGKNFRIYYELGKVFLTLSLE